MSKFKASQGFVLQTSVPNANPKLSMNNQKSHLLASMAHFFACLGLAFVLALSGLGTAHAQTNPGPANCQELTDPDTKFQLEMCSAHVGCRLVMGIHTACVKAKKFLDNLKAVMSRDEAPTKDPQAPDTSLFGKLKSLVGGDKKEVNSNHVFEASLTDEMRAAAERDKDWQDKVKPIKDGIAQSKKEILITSADTYIGEVKNGKPDGWGVRFWPSGYMMRGSFSDGNERGVVDVLSAEQTQRTVTTVGANRSGMGLMYTADGRIYKGSIAQLDIPSGNGAFYKPDGTLISNGTYSAGILQVGEVFDGSGNIVEKVDKPGDIRRINEENAELARQYQALQKRDEEQRRLALERIQAAKAAEQQRLSEEAAAKEQAFRDSLNTMNPGQLFAKADELSTSGDKVKARELLRILLSRFPDHPLAAMAAQQMSNGAGQASPNTGTSPSGNVSPQNCDARLATQDREFEAVNRRPVPGGATPPLQRVMWMTSERIKLIKANCPNTAKYQQMIQEMQTAYDQSDKACGQMMAGNVCPGPNPY